MDKSIERLQDILASVRVGRASPGEQGRRLQGILQHQYWVVHRPISTCGMQGCWTT